MDRTRAGFAWVVCSVAIAEAVASPGAAQSPVLAPQASMVPTAVVAPRADVPDAELIPPMAEEWAVCALEDETRGEVWRRTIEARSFDERTAKSVLRLLQDSLVVEASARPQDLEAQYDLALVLGVRAEIEGGTEKVRTAEAMDRQARAVLAVDHGHAGAQHLLGRLSAAVLRMNGVKRFFATRILGGERLSGASWAEARAWLESAATKDPCIPDHHYELASLYHERGEPGLAVRALERVFAVTGSRELFADVLVKAHVLAETMEREARR